MSEQRLAAGAMSGTSVDGVDVAIVRVSGRGYEMRPELVCHHHQAYSADVRSAIFQIRRGDKIDWDSLAGLGREISLAYAAAVSEAMRLAGLRAAQIACIAAHGQTLFHRPPLTIQWLDPALLAWRTGCVVVSDFRRADCAAGGEGAPLVPFADYILFRHTHRSRVLINIGGIANLTFIPAGAALNDLIAFDTGPGNCISDWLMRRLEPQGKGYDEGGRRALCGRPDAAIVDRVLDAEYFARRPPKSTDGPAMIGIFESAAGPLDSQRGDDLLASAARITALALARAIQRCLPGGIDEAIVSGGGTENEAIMSHLRAAIGDLPLRRTDEVGVSSQSKEAVAFALLGLATLDGVPANVPSATGASRAVVLGCVTPVP